MVVSNPKIGTSYFFTLLKEIAKENIRYQDNWTQYKNEFEKIPQFIDSLASYIKESNDRNISLWPINIQSSDFSDKDKPFDEAISMMKQTYSTRIAKLDILIHDF